MASGTTLFGDETQVHPAHQPRREDILEQLGRILSSPLFKHSRHYPAFLRYVVEQALDGNEPRLKERAIGANVFSRDPNYDTNLDPVVRTSACEVRKRIAAYYQEPGHENEIRIELHSGCYLPEFHSPASLPEPIAEKAEESAPPAPAVAEARPQWHAVAAILVTPLLLGIGAVTLSGPSTPLEQFWGPVWDSAESIMLCMGGTRPPAPSDTATAPGPTVLDVMRSDRLAFADAVAMGRITGLLRASRKKFDIRHGDDFTLTELRSGPLVLIGAFNNAWTIRLQESLRFWFEKDHTTQATYIRDRQQANQRIWKTDPTQPYAQFTRDYAMVCRFVNPLTERMVVIVAGMNKDGTMAAGEFVSEPQYLEALARQAPAGWQRKNVQVVIRTEVVKGAPGPPTIVATHFW